MNSNTGRLVATIGELEICELCDGSPHKIGCPRHPRYENDDCVYERVDAPTETGSARFWVEETYAAAAIDAGVPELVALREGINEFMTALERHELRRVESAGRDLYAEPETPWRT